MTITFSDLFAGVGGFHLALSNLGARCVYTCEYDTRARETYELNFPMDGIPFDWDITEVVPSEVPKHDVLCAGWPCQPFSVAGAQLGFQHETQGTLFFDLCSIIQEVKPQVIFLENVKNLYSHNKKNTFKVVENSLEKLGYTLRHTIINATKHGNLPQNRERVIIVGFRDPIIAERFEFPEEIPLSTELFGDVIDIHTEQESSLYQTNLESPSVQKMLDGVVEKKCIYQYRRYYVRQSKNGVCPTLTANMGTGGHNVPLLLDDFGVRKLSTRECFTLQGFPETYKLPEGMAKSQLYKQAGNSIPVTAIQRIAKAILEALDKKKT